MAAQDLWFELTAAQRSDQRSQAELDRRPDEIRTIRGYLFEEEDGTLGTICLYEATGSQVIHVHGRNADVAVSEIRRVAAIDVHRPRSRSSSHPDRESRYCGPAVHGATRVGGVPAPRVSRDLIYTED